jgi:mono/diheme cytochrome c family protein
MYKGSYFLRVATAAVLSGAMAWGLASSAWAQEMGPGGRIITGKGQFRTHCASCHGMDGKGDGPIAPALKVKPANLTTLAKDNGGVFPEEKVTKAINGTAEVGAHGTGGAGTTPMPVWGLAFRASSESGSGADFTTEEVDKKIKLLVDYIKTIQEK